MVIAMSHRPFEVFAHERAFREHAGEQEGEEDGEPAVDRETGIEMDRVRRGRNGLADRTNDEAQAADFADGIALSRRPNIAWPKILAYEFGSKGDRHHPNNPAEHPTESRTLSRTDGRSFACAPRLPERLDTARWLQRSDFRVSFNIHYLGHSHDSFR